MKNTKAGRKKKEANYEEAMKEAFSEIFENLREIEKDTKMQREKVDLERRRGSAPAFSCIQATERNSHKKIVRTNTA